MASQCSLTSSSSPAETCKRARSTRALALAGDHGGYLPCRDGSERMAVQGVVKKWGNSAAVRIPASILEAAQVRLDQPVDVRKEGGRIVIEPVRPARYDIEGLVGGITDENRHEAIDMGDAVGREAWSWRRPMFRLLATSSGCSSTCRPDTGKPGIGLRWCSAGQLQRPGRLDRLLPDHDADQGVSVRGGAGRHAGERCPGRSGEESGLASAQGCPQGPVERGGTGGGARQAGCPDRIGRRTSSGSNRPSLPLTNGRSTRWLVRHPRQRLSEPAVCVRLLTGNPGAALGWMTRLLA